MSDETTLLTSPELSDTEPVIDPKRAGLARGTKGQKRSKMPKEWRNRISYYKNYMIMDCVTKGYFKTKFRWKFGNNKLPRSFLFKSNLQNLQKYIDSLISVDAEVQVFYEKNGIAYSHEYATDTGKGESIPVSAFRLMAIIRGEDPLCVPMEGIIRLTEGNARSCRLLPTEIAAELLSKEIEELHIAELHKKLDKGLPILYVTGKTDVFKKFQGRIFQDVSLRNTGMNLAIVEKHEGISPVAPDAPAEGETLPAEELVHLQDFGTHHEEVIIKRPADGGMPYFVRRLSKDAHLLWCGTSYCVNGPWKVYHIDQQRLLSLGIYP